MTLRSVFLFAPAETAQPDVGAPALAIALAAAHGASLTAFVVALDVTTPGRQSDVAGLARAIEAAAGAAGVECRTITDHSHAIGVHEAVAAHARLHDLAVIGNESGGLLSERLVAEHLLFDSGRPVLLAPRRYAGTYAPGSLAVAWDGSAPAARALGDALALLDPTAVSFVTIEGEKALVLEPGMAEVTAVTVRRGPEATHRLVDLAGRGIAEALQHEAESAGAGMLVMGAFARSRLRSLVMGSATSAIMADTRMPVLLSH